MFDNRNSNIRNLFDINKSFLSGCDKKIVQIYIRTARRVVCESDVEAQGVSAGEQGSDL